mgnify:CR=1 FL=1
MKIKSIRDVKISKKLMILGAVSILGLFLMGKESIATARQIDQVGAELNDVWMNAVIAAEELNTVTSDYRITESRHAVTADSELMGELEQDMLESQAHKAKVIVSKAGKLLSYDEYKEIMDQGRI